jgi:hypothetical protein
LIVQSWAEAHVILVHLYEFYGPFLHGYKIRIIDWSSIKHLGTGEMVVVNRSIHIWLHLGRDLDY